MVLEPFTIVYYMCILNCTFILFLTAMSAPNIIPIASLYWNRYKSHIFVCINNSENYSRNLDRC